MGGQADNYKATTNNSPGLLTARTLAEHPALLRDVIDQMQAGVIVTDMQGRFLLFNAAAERFLGMGAIEQGPEHWTEVFGIFHSDTTTPLATEDIPLVRALAGESVDEAAVFIRHPALADGVHLSVSARPLLNSAGAQIGSIASFNDVTTLRQLSEEAEFFAHHDTLTGLWNRRAFETRLAQLLAQASAAKPAGIILIDLDRLKLINDTVGHEAGDEAIKIVGQALVNICGDDAVARLNGDEFAILQPGADEQTLQSLGDTALAAIRKLNLCLQGHRFALSASAGGVVINEPGLAAEQVMGAVSGACMDAKGDGRDRLQIESTARNRKVTSRAQMQNLLALEGALADQRLGLAMELMRPTRGHDVPMAEMLIRLTDADGQVHRPGPYLMAAERFNRMQQIDMGVCAAVLQYLQGNPDEPNRISINLSADSVRDPVASDLLLRLLAQFPDQASRLTVEVTESAALGELDQAVALTHSLKDLGCHVALDDFGAGFSNYSYLKRLAVDYLKIDGGLVQGMLDSQVDSAIVRSLIDLCRTLRLGSIAEFVDSEKLIDGLTMMGVDYLQGYSIGKAKPVDAVVMSDPMSMLRS